MASFGASSAAACGGGEEDRPQQNVGDERVDDQSDEGDESDKDDFRDWQAEDGEDEEESAVKSLFCAQKLPSLTELVEHDKKHFGFDLQATVKDFCEDDFSYIKLINFIRATVKDKDAEISNKEELVAIVRGLMESRAFLDGETYLKPVIESDPLLFLFDELFEFE